MPVDAESHVPGIEQRWPARTRRLVADVLRLCDDWLYEPLRVCMADFDSRLASSAASLNTVPEQQAYQLTRARLVQDIETFERRFAAAVRGSFAQLGQAAPVAQKSSAGPTLSLLDPHAHELGSALDQLAQRSELQGGQALVELGYRLGVLVAAPPLEGRALPLSPQSMLTAFERAATALQLPPEHQLLLLQSFDQALMRQLGALQIAVNAALQAEGILPRLRAFSSLRTPRRPRARRPPIDDGQYPDRSTTEVVAPRRFSPSTENAAEKSFFASPAPTFDAVTAESAPRAIESGSPSDFRVRETGPARPQASDDELRQALDALQWTLDSPVAGPGNSWQQLHTALVEQLNAARPAGAAMVHLGPAQAQAMARVVHWFREAQGQLPRTPAIATLLARLHWPLLRVVLSSPHTCMQPGLAPYQLLRKVVEVARDWLPDARNEPDHTVMTQLEQSLQPLADELPDADLCDSVREELDRHLAQWRDKARIAERRHVEAMRGRERLERARGRAGELLSQRLLGTVAGGPLRALFDDAWADVLALALLRQGENSTLFATLLVITDQLLGRLPAGDRQRLQQSVEQGLQQIGLHGGEATRMAQSLIAAGHSDEDDRARRRSRSSTAPVTQQPAMDADYAQGTIDPAVAARRTAMLARLREARFGGWFEFVDGHGGPGTQRRLAWFSALSGRCLFVTRRGQRAEEMDLDQLSEAIMTGQVRELRTDESTDP